MAVRTHSLSVNGVKVIQVAGEAHQPMTWRPAPELAIVVRKTDHVTATGSCSISYEELGDGDQIIRAVYWAAGTPWSATDIIDAYARQLADRRLA